MKKLLFFAALLCLLLLPACTKTEQTLPVESAVSVLEESSTADLPPEELVLCGNTYALDVETLWLDSSFCREDAEQLVYAEKLRTLSLELSAAYMREEGEEAFAFLKDCSSLEDLSLYVNLNPDESFSLNVLPQCGSLQRLFVSTSAQADLSPVTACTSLTELTLEGGSLDSSGLSGMTLERLNLTGYSDLSPLQNLCSLSSLSVGLSRYPVDFSSLQELGILELNLTGLGSNVDPDSVASITTLQSLQVSDEGLHDISALIQMPALTQMVLWLSPDNPPETDLKTLNLAESAWLNELTTPIPVEQLEQFLQQENRTIRFIRRAE